PLQVAQHRDRPVEFILQRADRADRLGMRRVVAVAEVDAKGVGPGPEQAPQHVGVAAGRAHRGEDLDLAAARFELCGHAAAPYGRAARQDKDRKCPRPSIRSISCPTKWLPRPSAASSGTCAIATTRRTSTSWVSPGSAATASPTGSARADSRATRPPPAR